MVVWWMNIWCLSDKKAHGVGDRCLGLDKVILSTQMKLNLLKNILISTFLFLTYKMHLVLLPERNWGWSNCLLLHLVWHAFFLIKQILRKSKHLSQMPEVPEAGHTFNFFLWMWQLQNIFFFSPLTCLQTDANRQNQWLYDHKVVIFL